MAPTNTALVKGDDDRHDLARMQLASGKRQRQRPSQLLSVPLPFKALPEIIDMAAQFQ